MFEYHANTTMKDDGISYAEFEMVANRGREEVSYPPVKFGGFEWLDGWYFFQGSGDIGSQTASEGYRNEASKLYCIRIIAAAIRSIEDYVS
jgi:hypothetical protein